MNFIGRRITYTLWVILCLFGAIVVWYVALVLADPADIERILPILLSESDASCACSRVTIRLFDELPFCTSVIQNGTWNLQDYIEWRDGVMDSKHSQQLSMIGIAGVASVLVVIAFVGVGVALRQEEQKERKQEEKEEEEKKKLNEKEEEEDIEQSKTEVNKIEEEYASLQKEEDEITEEEEKERVKV
jgi:hypothetical protein